MTYQPTCPDCGKPPVYPSEGRYCPVCEDHEGTCENDHCIGCGLDL